MAFSSEKLTETNGYLYSVGIGEIPFVKQGTLSIWQNEKALKNFAYTDNHAAILAKSKKEKWYKEEMFVRFELLEEKHIKP